MKTAIISFDPNIAEEFKNQLGETNVRVYIDSISMLKELEDFKPLFIVYDASAGDFAFDDLKFLLSRDKVKGIKFKVLYSKDQPIEDSEILSQDIDIYEKSSELYKVISDILEESKKLKEEEELKLTNELTTQQPQELLEDTFEQNLTQDLIQNQVETNFQSPESVEEIYSQNLSYEDNFEESFEEFTDMSIEEIEQVKPSNNNLGENFDLSINEELPKTYEEPKEENQPLSHKEIILKLSKEDIENAIVKLAVDKLVSQLKEDAEIKEIFENVKLDFVNRVNLELEALKEEIKKEAKNNIFKKVEEELYKKLNTELKDYIAEQIATIIKEKINQAFKM
jgi:hypothetical protein